MTAPEPAPENAPAEGPISAFAAAGGVFFTPGATFDRLKASPTWWLPFVLFLFAVLGATFVATPKIDFETTVREAIQKRTAKSGQEVPEAVIKRQVEISEKFAKYAAPFATVFSTVVFFLVALILWAAAKAFGSEVSFLQALAGWGHANLPNILGAFLSIPVFLTLPDASMTQQAAQFAFKSNIGAFLSEETVTWVRTLASSADVFALWSLALLVLAFRRFPALSRGAATAIPIVLWGLWVVLKTGWAALMG